MYVVYVYMYTPSGDLFAYYLFLFRQNPKEGSSDSLRCRLLYYVRTLHGQVSGLFYLNKCVCVVLF